MEMSTGPAVDPALLELADDLLVRRVEVHARLQRVQHVVRDHVPDRGKAAAVEHLRQALHGDRWQAAALPVRLRHDRVQLRHAAGFGRWRRRVVV